MTNKTRINIGDIIGSYKILARDYSKKAAAAYWQVECIYCGYQKIVRSDSLKKNSTCKCQKDTMIDKVFGDFLVLNKCKEKAKDNCLLYQCKCIKCGHIENVASNVLRSNRKHCSNCHIRKSTIIDMTGQTYGYITVLERDTSLQHMGHENDAYWICRCNLCGTIKSIRGISLRNGITRSCGCIESHGEVEIAKILAEHNIIFEKEYRFDDLRYKNQLRFDFAIFNQDGTLSHLVEYDGIQHFEARESGWNTVENLKKTQLRDAIKNQYCLDNNIKLVRIKYNENITFEKIMGE